MEKQEKLMKLQNTCRTLGRAMKVLEAIVVVIGLVAEIGCLVALIRNVPTDVIDVGINLGALKATHLEEIFGLRISIIFVLAAFAVAVFLICAVLERIRKTFAGIVEMESPFTEETTKNIKTMGIIMTVIVLISSGLITALLCGLVFNALYYLFDYGCELQKESDETL